MQLSFSTKVKLTCRLCFRNLYSLIRVTVGWSQSKICLSLVFPESIFFDSCNCRLRLRLQEPSCRTGPLAPNLQIGHTWQPRHLTLALRYLSACAKPSSRPRPVFLNIGSPALAHGGYCRIFAGYGYGSKPDFYFAHKAAESRPVQQNAGSSKYWVGIGRYCGMLADIV